jgi:predicted PP-loop superfamily ATPase
MICPQDAVIQAILQHDRDIQISGTKKVRGLRGQLDKVVLAYSGGLDTSVIVPWLRYVSCFIVPFFIFWLGTFALVFYQLSTQGSLVVLFFPI